MPGPGSGPLHPQRSTETTSPKASSVTTVPVPYMSIATKTMLPFMSVNQAAPSSGECTMKHPRLKDTVWWKSWKTVRFLQVQNETDRLTLELHLILALKPPHNSKPGSREFGSMFERT